MKSALDSNDYALAVDLYIQAKPILLKYESYSGIRAIQKDINALRVQLVEDLNSILFDEHLADVTEAIHVAKMLIQCQELIQNPDVLYAIWNRTTVVFRQRLLLSLSRMTLPEDVELNSSVEKMISYIHFYTSTILPLSSKIHATKNQNNEIYEKALLDISESLCSKLTVQDDSRIDSFESIQCIDLQLRWLSVISSIFIDKLNRDRTSEANDFVKELTLNVREWIFSTVLTALEQPFITLKSIIHLPL